MDPKECIKILSKAYADHQGNCQCGEDDCGVPPPPQPLQGVRPARRREFILEDPSADAGGEDSADDVEVSVSQEPARINSEAGDGRKPEAHYRGQIIDIASGENETLVSAEAILEEFPALGPPAGAAPVLPAAEVPFAPPARRTPAELVSEVVRVHTERVQVHKAYDGAFRRLLSGKGGGRDAVARLYPLVTSLTTARFQELSERVRSAATGLEEAAARDGGGDAKEAADLARALQSCEKDRLQLVAQHHVEQIRMGPPRAGDEPEPAPVAAARSNCVQLRQRLGATDAQIEETVSELRYCMADLLGD